MPNHTAQLLTINGPKAEIAKLHKLVVTKDSPFDHTTFFPMPKAMKGTSSPATVVGDSEIEAARAAHVKQQAEYPESFRSAGPISASESRKLIRNFGANNWYDWANQNWGTKWGIYDAQDWSPGDMVSFNSAWSPANLLIQKLSEKFPKLKFNLKAADEGGGFVCEYAIENGESACTDYDWDSKDGIDVRIDVGYGPENTEE